MTTINNYIDYLKDNPKGYWFKRKLYGWGWVPVTWQGWMVLLALVVYLVYFTHVFLGNDNPIEFIISIVIAFAALIAIGYWKGEKPRWQWGLKTKHSPKEKLL